MRCWVKVVPPQQPHTAEYGPQIVPLCTPYPGCVQTIVQLFQSHTVTLGKYLPSPVPAQHVGQLSHLLVGYLASNSQLWPPGMLLTVALQATVLQVLPAGVTPYPSPGSPAGSRAAVLSTLAACFLSSGSSD